MNNSEQQYLDLLKNVLDNGVIKKDRTGTGTISLFSPPKMVFDLKEGFPLWTTKRVPFRLVAEELLWFISGSTDVRDLIDKNVNIWTADAVRWFNEKLENKTGQKNSFSEKKYISLITNENIPESQKKINSDLGNLYGKQLRAWDDSNGETIDQLQWVIDEIKNNPDSRRLIIDLWHVGDVYNKRTALPSCHNKYQFYVNEGKLSCMMECRSNDLFLGSPFNAASGSLLTHLIAIVCDLDVGKLHYNIGDAHIYLNHIHQVKEQLKRKPLELPKIKINKKSSIDDFEMSDFEIIGYNPMPSIKGKISV